MYICGKCGSTELSIEKYNRSTGLYCSICGKWVRWLGDDDLRSFESQQKRNLLNGIDVKTILSEASVDDLLAEIRKRFSPEEGGNLGLIKVCYTCKYRKKSICEQPCKSICEPCASCEKDGIYYSNWEFKGEEGK